MQFRILDSFPAAHRIRIDGAGTLEPVHVHHWRVDVRFFADEYDPAVVLRAREAVCSWVARHRGRSLNDVPPYDVVNPTAEEVARCLALEMAHLSGLQVLQVQIGEAAGFSAIYRPPCRR